MFPIVVLFSFQNGTGTPSGCSNCTGSTPHGRPVVVNIGTVATPIDVLLGMTCQGGYTSGGNSKGNGAIYAYTPSANAYTVLHLFGGLYHRRWQPADRQPDAKRRWRDIVRDDADGRHQR